MFIKIKQGLLNIGDILHIRLFGHGMGNRTKQFLGNLSWSFFGGLGASVVMMGINILAGRYMGPIGYGQYGLILTISQILMVFLVFGLDLSSVRSIAMSKSISKKSKHISSVIFFTVFSSSLLIVLFIIVRNYIAQQFHTNAIILSIAVVYAIIASFKIIADSIARGLFLFKEQFFARIVEVGTVVFLFSLFFFYFEERSYPYYLVALLGGSLFFIVWLASKFSGYVTRFDFESLKEQLSYSSFLVVGTVLGTAFNSLDKFIIVQYLSVQELGIYMAYFMASTNLIAQATQIFINVLFPQIASMNNGDFLKRIEKLFMLLFVPGFIIVSFVIGVIIALFGKNFDFRLEYVFSFGLLGMLQIIYTVYASIMTAVSKTLYKKFLLVFNIVNFSHIIFYGILIYINQVSIMAIVLLFILNIFVVIQLQRRMLKKYFETTVII
ncbi:MAG: oligosaccharide flippase family protein [bacterium]|nr:oligosaccharide flippase family protein [bacterium]